MLTQGRAFIVVAVQAALLQDRDHLIDKIIKRRWCAAADDKPIGRATGKPLFQTIRDLCCRAVKSRARGGRFQRCLTQG